MAPRQELPTELRPAPSFSQVSIVTLPGDVSPEHEIETRLVVLIDALRMSSTLVTAMGQGLEAAQLFSSVMEVTHAVQNWGACALLGGEQKRVLIPGFDRDNSPRSYLDGVEEKTALFLTTNGTRALPWVRRAKMLVLGSFLNASAVVRTVMAQLKEVSGVVFLCAGTERGTVRSQDDELCAGYLLRTLLASHGRPSSLLLDDVAVSVLQKLHALDSWQAVSEAFHATPAAGELRKIDLGGDVEFCVQRDRYRDVLPFYVAGQDLFFCHRAHYDVPVRYEAVKRQRPGKVLEQGGVVQVYLVQAAADERRQRELVEGFKWAEVAFVACSPAHGCRVTAEAIAGEYGPVEVYGGLAPVDSGDWAGLSRKEVGESFPGGLERWHGDVAWCGHGGESFQEVHGRALATFKALLTGYLARGCSGAAVVVTHGLLAHAILTDVMGMPLEKAAEAWWKSAEEEGAVALVEVSVPAGAEPEKGLPAGCGWRVTRVGRGAVPVALSSRVSRL